MPLPVLQPMHLSATTVLLLLGIAAIFLALQKAVVRRLIKTLLSSAPAKPAERAPAVNVSVIPSPLASDAATPAATDSRGATPGPATLPSA